MHNPKSSLENEILNTNLMSARRLDQVIINKKKRTCRTVAFAVPTDQRVKSKKSEKKDKYLNFARELKKNEEHESDGDTNCNWSSWYCHQRIGTRTGGLGRKRTSGDHPNYRIIDIGQNTKKNPGDLRRLTIT